MRLVGGLHTQPAVPGFATEQTQNDLSNLGYVSAFAPAGIARIILVQLLIALLN